jgi:hypothetical protein
VSQHRWTAIVLPAPEWKGSGVATILHDGGIEFILTFQHMSPMPIKINPEHAPRRTFDAQVPPAFSGSAQFLKAL